MAFNSNPNQYTYNTVSESQANNNGEVGMSFEGGSGNTVTDCQANGKEGPAIFLEANPGSLAGADTLLSGDTANGNGAQGISAFCPSNLFGNTARGNTGGDIVTFRHRLRPPRQ